MSRKSEWSIYHGTAGASNSNTEVDIEENDVVVWGSSSEKGVYQSVTSIIPMSVMIEVMEAAGYTVTKNNS